MRGAPPVAEERRSLLDTGGFGLDGEAKRTLRLALMRAGYFDASAVATYTLARLGALVVLPLLGLAIGAASSRSSVRRRRRRWPPRCSPSLRSCPNPG